MEFRELGILDHTVDAYNVNDAFLKCAEKILTLGKSAYPRGFNTQEISPLMVHIQNPKDCLITFKNRKMPYKFMIMELMWILSGDKEPWIFDYLAKYRDYSNKVGDKDYLFGAYGPRLRRYQAINHFSDPASDRVENTKVDQLSYVIQKLTNDTDSRQAIMSIWNPVIDTIDGNKDIPCTNLFKFSIRDKKLNMTVFMRSNDLVKGACIDWFNFCIIQNLLASILNVGVGDYWHIADSLHLYDTDYKQVKEILADPTCLPCTVPSPVKIPMGYSCLSKVDDDITYAKDLFKTKATPNNERYLSKLMRWVANKLMK